MCEIEFPAHGYGSKKVSPYKRPPSTKAQMKETRSSSTITAMEVQQKVLTGLSGLSKVPYARQLPRLSFYTEKTPNGVVRRHTKAV